MRPHFVMAQVKIHLCADGANALFPGRCIGRYDAYGTLKDAKSAADRPHRMWTAMG
jgi:hypothetical protein